MPELSQVNDEEQQEQLARQLWTLGDLNRLRILSRLPLNPDCKTRTNVSQLAEELGLSQPTVSNHLARLRTLGIVRCQRMCRDSYYWIDVERCEEITKALQETLLTDRRH
ncbi:MAG: metalloregulator ArsR/SmtB family transcription factor [Verrucomicrobiota bacterium JB022]|nr:metalloregulator ArsR/SmtB family transcription factor [Verrucomicrobiota bacterium JB022]